MTLTYRFTETEWRARDARCDRMAELCTEILDVDAGDTAAWTVTGGRTEIVGYDPEGSTADKRVTREWINVVCDDPARVRRLHDAFNAERLISASRGHAGGSMSFVPWT